MRVEKHIYESESGYKVAIRRDKKFYTFYYAIEKHGREFALMKAREKRDALLYQLQTKQDAQ